MRPRTSALLLSYFLSLLSYLLLLPLLPACSPAPMPVSRSQSDPSNPDAPEGIVASAVAPPRAAPTTSATAYVCPMHPEVTAKEPGTCPKCNMKLVPKE